ncbi:MAG: hypothetical protein R3F20_16275 [Planctomycetota bacterium]
MPAGEGSRSRGALALAAALLVTVLGVLPYALHAPEEFRSDDAVMVAMGRRGDLPSQVAAAFTRPWLDTWIVQFYRPLYSLHFAVESRLFGDDPRPYYLENLAWQGLALLFGTLLVARRLGPRGALLAGLFLAASPWSVNNLVWLVGRSTTVATVSALLAAWLHLRDRDRRWRLGTGEGGISIAALIVITAGIFYRETAFFGALIAAGFDVVEGRRGRRDAARWAALLAPFALYLVARRLVLGTFTGGYARLKEFLGWDLSAAPPVDLLPRLVVAGRGLASGPDWSLLESGLLALAAAVVIAGLLGRGRRLLATAAVFGGLVVLHAVPLVVVDPVLQAGASQRWHTVTWALGGLLAALALRSRWPGLAAIALLAITAHQGLTTWRWIESGEDSARLVRSLRETVAERGEATTFVYNLKPYVGPMPFFEVGLGFLGERPFSGDGGEVYPISYEGRYLESDALAQTPIAAALAARGEKVRAFAVDWDAGAVAELPAAMLAAAGARAAALPRIEDFAPAGPVLERPERLVFSGRAPAARRAVVHLVTRVAETLAVRDLAPDPETGRFTLEMDGLLELAAFGSERGRGRAFLWVVLYDEEGRAAAPVGVSEILDLRVDRPPRRP